MKATGKKITVQKASHPLEPSYCKSYTVSLIRNELPVNKRTKATGKKTMSQKINQAKEPRYFSLKLDSLIDLLQTDKLLPAFLQLNVLG